MARKITKNPIALKLVEASKIIFFDLLLDNFTESALNLHFKGLNSNIYHENLFRISKKIVDGNMEYFQTLKEHNNTYIESKKYDKMTNKQLEKEFDKDLVKSISGTGIAPEQMMLYVLTTGNRKKDYSFFEETYIEYLELSTDYKNNWQKLPKLNDMLSGSRMEAYFQQLFLGEYKTVATEEETNKIIDQYRAIKIDDKYIKIPIGFLFFVEEATLDIFSKLATFEEYYGILHGNFLKVNAYFKEIEKEHNEFLDIKDDLQNEVSKNKNLDLENINLRNKIKELESIIDNNLISTQKKEINYLHSRIEKLEQEIKDIEQDETLEILNDVEIEEIENRVQRMSLSTKRVVVLGGTYNSRQKEEIEEIITNKNSEISFVPADRIFRNGEKIKNSDVVIFDTSYNSHSAFYKVKSICDNIVFVNSTKELIELIS